MSPRRFYIGFPPAIVKVKRRGIEYGLGAIPLGGYVKIPGMHRPAPSDLDTFFGPARDEAPELHGPIEHVKRKLEEGDMEGARAELDVLREALGRVELTRMASNGAQKGLNELGDGLGSDAYWRQRTWRKVIVIFAGPGTNLLFAIILFATLFVIGSGGYRLGFTMNADAPVVAKVSSDHPAATIGLQPGDRIVAINGQAVQELADVPALIQDSKGGPVTLTVRRNGDVMKLRPVRPRKEEQLSVPRATWESIRFTGVITKEIGASLSRLVRGSRKEVSSPVGIVEGSSEALSQGVETYLWVLGLLSLSLALLNLLPLLPLDGGHIAFSIVEGIRGRAVGREVYERVSAIGIAVVLLLFFIGLSNDIGNLGG
jgi:regulator of sigma E protease